MVLQKRLDYGFNGYQVPPIPRAPRSARRRASFRKKFRDNQMGAFDLLATIAGKLLLEGEHSPISIDTLVNGESRIEIGTIASNVDAVSTFCCKLEDENKKQIKIEPPITGTVSISANADIRDDVKLGFRDDDENSSWCTQPSIIDEAFKPPPRIGDRRIRKILASKYRKLTTKFKDEQHFSTDAELKPVYRNRKNCYKRQRSLRDYPLKKRRLYDRISLSNSKRDVSAFAADKHRSFQPCDSHGMRAFGVINLHLLCYDILSGSYTKIKHHFFIHSVRLKIKSFRVPELFIEIAETATVGSLKRAVMDAVTAILSGGLRVGVLLQGKKIRDDNKTLLQTGISHNNELDALGFTLEPNPSLQAPPHQYPDDPSFLQSSETPPSLIRYPTAPNVVEQGTFDTSRDHMLIESDHDSALSPAVMVMDKSALVVVPAMAAVPMQKSKGRDVGQRRIRRPFSVSEVETLVRAVEKLGTGRWRDVKLLAFDNAKQRTYVDLKDKWKTLVHTARISPQQRRGEPVPQELLDRVLIAHAYWSKQQHLKQYL